MDKEQIRQRWAKATKGPWRACAWDCMERPHVTIPIPPGECCHHRYDLPQTRDDAHFIAHSWQDVHDLLSALDAAEARGLSEWRPFASAPKDETEILVYRPDAGVFTAHYYPSINEDGERDIDNYCWFTVQGEDLTGDLPTHWMPLPDGPDAAETERTRGPWEADEHHNLGTMGSPKSWKYVKHNFPNAPYEGELENEWGIYPPLGQSGPVALVAGKANAEFIVTACNAHDDLLSALDVAEAKVSRMRKALETVIEGDQGWNFAGDTSLADIARDAVKEE